MAVEINPLYDGPALSHFIKVSEPDADALRSIPLNISVILSSPDGTLSEYHWDEGMLSDSLSWVEENGSMLETLFIYVDPEIIKEGH